MECQNTFHSDMKKMFEKELFWDVKLDINGTEIKAHKNVLYARSAFFKNLLEKDDQQDCIKICEDLELFRLLLEYMYVNTIVVQDSSMLVLLYILAKKYGVEEMQEFCRSQLENTLSVENVTYFYEKVQIDIFN